MNPEDISAMSEEDQILYAMKLSQDISVKGDLSSEEQQLLDTLKESGKSAIYGW
jgi:hypothetical protein